ncbi:MAG: GNAT family N-acetyltransferase, partial [Pseudomonadota bacterium]
MPNQSFLDGWFRSLAPYEGEALVSHWERLPEPCIRRRFLRPMNHAAFTERASLALGSGGEVIGWFRDGILRGVSELYTDGETGEAAFTVEPGYRSKGIGQALLDHVLRRARNRGCARLIVMTTRENQPMIRIATKAGAHLEYEGTEVVGTVALAPATGFSRLADLREDEAGILASMAAR